MRAVSKDMAFSRDPHRTEVLLYVTSTKITGFLLNLTGRGLVRSRWRGLKGQVGKSWKEGSPEKFSRTYPSTNKLGWKVRLEFIYKQKCITSIPQSNTTRNVLTVNSQSFQAANFSQSNNKASFPSVQKMMDCLLGLTR